MKLKSYVYFVERPDGCLVRGADRSFVVKGQGAYAKVARLLGYCDGRFSRDQLRAAVAVDAQPWFDSLVAELESNRFLLPIEPLAAPIEDAPGVADTLAYLSDWHEAPRAALRLWRNARVALFGDGEAVAIAARSLREFGVGGLTETAADASLAIVLYDAINTVDLAAILDAAGSVGTPVLLAGGMAGGALVLPILPNPAAVQAVFDRVRLPDLGVDTSSEIALTIGAGLAAIEALHHVVGGPSPAPHEARRLYHVGAHGFVDPHVVPPAYLGPVAAPAPVDWATEDDPAHDPVVGLFTVDHRDTDRQMPLHLFGMRVALPRSAGGGDRIVSGWGLTERDAAYRAHLAAVTAYVVADDATERRIAACRDAARLTAMQAAGALAVEATVPLADIVPPAGNAAMLARLLRIYGIVDIRVGTANGNGWIAVAVAVAGRVHRCLGEDVDTALAEILGALVAACQMEVDIADIAVPPLAARLPDDSTPVADGGIPVGTDPVLRRLGWHVAELA